MYLVVGGGGAATSQQVADVVVAVVVVCALLVRAVVAFQAWSFARRLSACRAGAECGLLCRRASVSVLSSGTRYDEQVRDPVVASSGAPAWEEQAVGRGPVVQQALALVHHGQASARECLRGPFSFHGGVPGHEERSELAGREPHGAVRAEDEATNPAARELEDRLFLTSGLLGLFRLDASHSREEGLHDGAELLLRLRLVLRHVEVCNVCCSHGCGQRNGDRPGENRPDAAQEMDHEAGWLCSRRRVFLPLGEVDVGGASLLILVVCIATDCGLQHVRRRGREWHCANGRGSSIFVLLVACGDERFRHETLAAAHDILADAFDEESDVGEEAEPVLHACGCAVVLVILCEASALVTGEARGPCSGVCRDVLWRRLGSVWKSKRRNLAVGSQDVFLAGGAQPAGHFVLCRSLCVRVVAVLVRNADAPEAAGQPIHRHHALHCPSQG